MKPREVLRLYRKEAIPLADVRVVFPVLGCDFDRAEIEERELDEKRVQEVLDRLKRGYPAAYLAGELRILGVDLLLTEDVLIPRTETEDFLRAEILPHREWNGKRILDLCTGSGFIALALQKKFSDSIVYGTDVSDKAIRIASQNNTRNHLNVTFMKSDYLDGVDQVFDLIVCNPPYIPEGKETQAPYEPKLALFSGVDGMDSYRRIFPRLSSCLAQGGEADFELEATKGRDVFALAQDFFPSWEKELLPDFEGKVRYLRLRRRD